ncbi:hypothetical protein RhiirC2_780079 [Rhizophagus irregularis]|uniref:Uncharacterized protein n=1 Tax=Rhizophagus irregularis TaxID=588596 RepID=A0A2N1N8G2_9GLOM|nr:hypothetical protein RhiirC2_780079 [Rhizophagus irregularis]
MKDMNPLLIDDNIESFPITSANEATRCEFISAIIYGVASIFDGTVKGYSQYEVSIDGVIKMGDTIISVTEAKREDINQGVAQIQCGIGDRNDNDDGNPVEVFLCSPMPTSLPINYPSLSRDDLVGTYQEIIWANQVGF